MALPVELNLAGRPVVVVGGGAVAARRVEALIAAGAEVRVVSPAWTSALEQRTDIHRETRPYAKDVIEGAVLVFACTDDREVNARIAADARAAGIWCNAADDPTGSDFFMPATLRRGRFTIAVGTGGASPHLAARVRDELESKFGPEFAILTEEIGRARDIVRQQVPDPALRRRILETLGKEESVKLLALGDRAAWRRWLERMLESPSTEIPED